MTHNIVESLILTLNDVEGIVNTTIWKVTLLLALGKKRVETTKAFRIDQKCSKTKLVAFMYISMTMMLRMTETKLVGGKVKELTETARSLRL